MPLRTSSSNSTIVVADDPGCDSANATGWKLSAKPALHVSCEIMKRFCHSEREVRLWSRINDFGVSHISG